MKKGLVIISLVFVFLFILPSVVFIVPESQVAVIKTTGKISKVIVNTEELEKSKEIWAAKKYTTNPKFVDTKGLKFKIPFIQTVKKYSTKYKTYESVVEEVNTFDRRKIEIQMYAQYRIVNPAIYNLKLGRERESNRIIDDRVYPVVIQSANKLEFNDFFNKEKIKVAIESKKDTLNKELMKEYGIFVTDIGIHRKNFPQGNIQSIESKMVKEIQKESEKLRAEGNAEYVKTTAEVDRKATETVATARAEAAILKAAADAESMNIYRTALSKDVEFYRFIQRMETYKSMKDTTIFLDRDNDFLKYMNGY